MLYSGGKVTKIRGCPGWSRHGSGMREQPLTVMATKAMIAIRQFIGGFRGWKVTGTRICVIVEELDALAAVQV